MVNQGQIIRGTNTLHSYILRIDRDSYICFQDFKILFVHSNTNILHQHISIISIQITEWVSKPEKRA